MPDKDICAYVRFRTFIDSLLLRALLLLWVLCFH